MHSMEGRNGKDRARSIAPTDHNCQCQWSVSLVTQYPDIVTIAFTMSTYTSSTSNYLNLLSPHNKSAPVLHVSKFTRLVTCSPSNAAQSTSQHINETVRPKIA